MSQREMKSSDSKSLNIKNNSITYDTDNISIVTSFKDEMATYRSRREWVEVLSSHFLLEKERDFDLSISSNGDSFVLSCEFGSACGRYAFWRLINHQAPEAEQKLISAGYPVSQVEQEGSIRPGYGLSEESSQSPWVLSGGVSEPIRRRRKLTERIADFFSKSRD